MLKANSKGVVLQSEILGSVKMRVYLSGMPELRLGLNDKVQFENSGRKFLHLVFFNFYKINFKKLRW